MPDLIHRFVKRVRSDGIVSALISLLDYCGLDVVNLYNSLIFRDPRIFSSCDISIKMPSSATLPHPVGIVIGRKVEIGDNVKILQNVTLGGRGGDHPPGMPTIQDNVTIEAGGIVLGDITLHQDCIVGANSVVLDDVGEGETVVGSPATKVD